MFGHDKFGQTSVDYTQLASVVEGVTELFAYAFEIGISERECLNAK